jgi:CBS domain-containing protein
MKADEAVQRREMMEGLFAVHSQNGTAVPSAEPAANHDAFLESTDPAFLGLTDFRHEYLITVEADSPVEAALADMTRLGVQALLVTRQDVESMDQQVVGLITYHDIERSRPHRLPQAAVVDEHRELRVGEVMTPWNELPLVRYESLRSLSASELHEMFQGTGLTHLLVVESDDNGCALARGLLSRATLAGRVQSPRAASVR